MTSDQIVYFLTLEKHMNFSYAAEELNMSQPALSRQIQALETEISATLFNRNSRNITLTPAGMEFMAHAKKATEDYQNMILAMKHFSDKSRNKLIFTSLPIMSIYRLTQMVAEFRRTRSDISIAINEEDAKSVLASLESYRADVAYYIYDNMKKSGFKVFPVNEEEMVLIVGRKNHLAEKDEISLQEAADEEYLFLSHGSAVYDFGIELCVNAGFAPKIINELGGHLRLGTISELVSENYGVSLVLLQSAIFYSFFNFKIIRLKGRPKIKSGIVTRDEHLAPSCSVFVNFAVDYLKARGRQFSKSLGVRRYDYSSFLEQSPAADPDVSAIIREK